MCGRYSLALRLLLHVPPAFWSSQNLRDSVGAFCTPRPEGAPSYPSEESTGHSRSQAWQGEDTALQIEFWAEVPTKSHIFPSFLSMMVVPLQPLALPLCMGQGSAQG